MLREALERIDALEGRLNAIEEDMPLMQRLIPDFLVVKRHEARRGHE